MIGARGLLRNEKNTRRAPGSNCSSAYRLPGIARNAPRVGQDKGGPRHARLWPAAAIFARADRFRCRDLLLCGFRLPFIRPKRRQKALACDQRDVGFAQSVERLFDLIHPHSTILGSGAVTDHSTDPERQPEQSDQRERGDGDSRCVAPTKLPVKNYLRAEKPPELGLTTSPHSPKCTACQAPHAHRRTSSVIDPFMG